MIPKAAQRKTTYRDMKDLNKTDLKFDPQEKLQQADPSKYESF